MEDNIREERGRRMIKDVLKYFRSVLGNNTLLAQVDYGQNIDVGKQ